MKPTVTFEDFDKLDLQIGKVVECTKKEGSEKLLRLVVDFGEEKKTIFSGIAKFYTPDEILNKSFVFIVNLAPRKMMDEFSEGMLLCTNDEKPIPLAPIEESNIGSSIR